MPRDQIAAVIASSAFSTVSGALTMKVLISPFFRSGEL